MNDSSLVCGPSCVIQEAQQSRLLPSQCREGVSAIATNKKTSQESFTNACRLASPTIPSENIWLLSSLSNCLLIKSSPSLPHSKFIAFFISLKMNSWIYIFRILDSCATKFTCFGPSCYSSVGLTDTHSEKQSQSTLAPGALPSASLFSHPVTPSL